MGWGRMLLLGNFGQQLDIEEQREEMARLRAEVRRDRDRDRDRIRPAEDPRVASLEGEVDELRLYLAAIVRMVVARGVVTEEELRALVRSVDAEDGSEDGRHGGKIC